MLEGGTNTTMGSMVRLPLGKMQKNGTNNINSQTMIRLNRLNESDSEDSITVRNQETSAIL